MTHDEVLTELRGTVWTLARLHMEYAEAGDEWAARYYRAATGGAQIALESMERAMQRHDIFAAREAA